MNCGFAAIQKEGGCHGPRACSRDFGDGEKKFFFERASDELNADGQAF
jgi:hypothetical protein